MQAQGAFENAASTVLRGPRPVTAVLDGNELSIACFEGPIHEECLLGGDFVAAHVTAVDVQGDRLLLRNGGVVPLTRVSTPAAAISAVLEVHCDHSTVVAPHSSAIVSVSVSGRDFFGMPADGHPCALPVAPELAILGPRGEAALVGGGGGAGQRDAPCGPVGALRDAPCGPVGAPGDAACGPVGTPREAACGPVGTSGEHACGPAVASGSRSGAPVRVLRTRCASLPADLPPGLAVTSTLLADADGRALVVTVRNDADRPLTLRRGAHIGSLRVSALLPAYVGATMAEDAAAGVVLPAPLQALQDACSADLSEHEVVQVRQLLLEFQDAADPDIGVILRAVEDGTRPSKESVSNASVTTKALWLQWQSLEIRDNLLCRRFVDDRDRVTHQLVLPRVYIPAVLRTLHDAPGTGGHLGHNKTIAKVRAHYYWPGLCQEVKLWCLSCAVCRTKKGPPRRTRAPLTLHNVGVPWERVGVDLAGPFPRTARGNRYLLVAVDYFSKWPEAIPIPSAHSEVVARALVDNIFTRFGSPLEIHSDQGRSFESAVFRTVSELLGTRKTRTTPGRPQSDGAVERLIRTVVTQLGILTDANQSDWDLQVPLVLLSLRVARHSTTGVSPAMMLFGRELRLPPTLSQGLHPDTPDISTAREYPAWLRDRLHGLHHEVRERAWQAALASKERYDVRARRPAFAVGDLVWLYDPKRRRGRNPKLQCWWSGPHRITAMINDVVARLVDPARPRSRPRTVHVDRLAPAAPRQT
ncbi:Retrovirus-related Pol polyprotein from transposon 412 [Frankliniella fusca]|uniref:RNA-directed DNA polymerase n=1 Tax=Frankliniella fusca TaxID=407009 RepID=A0AAE1HIC8_9NEOP|nr:Retrovirus-related Pol polyprotein from transposon 412 [Frankliniella fusca]